MMADTVVEDSSACDLRKIIRKLGHNLHEVQQRSLGNILSKLTNGIISYEDLLHIRELYVHLLEWLRNEKQDGRHTVDILKLLTSLSEFSAGGKTLIELGGVEFFSLYRQNGGGDESVMELLDNVLNNLFLVHNEVEVDVATNDGLHATLSNDVSEYSMEKHAEILSKYEILKENRNSTLQSMPTTTATNIIEDIALENTEPFIEECRKTAIDASIATESLKDESFHLYRNDFQWIPLTMGDRQILSVTDNRLQSHSPDLIVQSCQFLRCVLFHDFPAEVFIQRPSIFSTLLSIVNTYEGKNTGVVEHVLACLMDLTKNLHKRLLQNQNGDLRPPPMTTPYSSDEFETTLMTECFMQAQCSLTEFALKSLSSTINLIKLYFRENHMFSHVVLLHKSVIRLLHYDDFKSYWCANTNSANKLVYDLMMLLHKFDNAICNFPVQTAQRFDLEGQSFELKLIIVSKLVVKLVFTAVPDDRVYEAVTDTIVNFLAKVLCNVALLSPLHNLRKGLEKLLKFADEKFYCRYTKALGIVKSMKHIDKWHGYVAADYAMVSDDDLIVTWRRILQSLSYHCHKDFISSTLQLCCERYKSSKENKHKWLEMLLSVLQHPNMLVIFEVYTCVLAFMKIAFSESLVSEPLSIKHEMAELLINKAVLTEIVCCGMTHESEKVSSTTKSIVSTLLLSRLNMSSNMWKTVLHNFTALIPILQGVLGNADEAYNKSLLSLVEHPHVILDVDGRKSGLSKVEQVRLLMRIFFLKVDKIRSKAFPLVLLHLINRNKEHKTVKNYPSASNINVGDMFVFSLQRLAVLVANTSCFEDISSDNVEKLWGVLTDRLVNEELRQSAAEQLAILTRDPLLQSAIMQNECYCFLTGEIYKLVNKRSPDEMISSGKYMLSLLKILNNVLGNHSSLRHILALQTNLYLDLLETGLAFVKHEEICYEISCILTYLLFCDIFQHPESLKEKGKLLLPKDICRNYRFPVEFSSISTKIKDSVDEEVIPAGDVLSDYIKHSCWLECEWYRTDDLQTKCNKRICVSREEKVLYEHTIIHLLQCITKGLSTPSDHFYAISYIGYLQVLLLACDKKESESTFFKEVMSFLNDTMNNGFIKNIISKTPMSGEDCELFHCVLFLMSMLVRLGVKQFVENFDLLVLSESVVGVIGEQTANKHRNEKLESLVRLSLVSFLASSLEYETELNLSSQLLDASKKPGISILAVAMYRNLSLAGSESYYNLPLLEIMLECFMHLLAHKMWSVDSTEGLCAQLFRWLSQIVVSFHFDRSTAGVSFMGKGIVRKSLICLCHLVREVKMVDKHGTFMTLLFNNNDYTQNDGDVSDGRIQHRLPWLVPLLSDRLIDVRWGALALSSMLVLEKNAEEMVVEEYQSLPGGIWAASIRLILDDKECYMVRGQACILLANLLQRGACELKENGSLWTQMVVQDTDSLVKVSGVDAFFMLLDHLDFFLRFHDIFLNNSNSSASSRSLQVSTSTLVYDSSEGDSQSPVSMNAYHRNSYSKVETSRKNNTGEKNNSEISDSSERWRERSDSISYKSSLLNLLSDLISLVPDVVVEKLKNLQILDTMFDVWSPVLILKSLHGTVTSQVGTRKLEYKEFKEHTKFLLSMLQLFSVVQQHDAQYCRELVQRNDITTKIFSLFNLCLHSQQDYLPFYISIWKNTISIIEKMLNSNVVDDINKLCTMSLNHLQYICGSLLSLLEHVKNDNPIIKRFINVIFLILKSSAMSSNEGKLACPLDSLYFEEDLVTIFKKNKHIAADLKPGCSSVGEVLCVLLIYLKTKLGLSKMSPLVVSALAHVFITSEKAKVIAYNNGLVETLIEELKDTLICLNISSLTEKKHAGKRKLHLVNDLCCLLALMRDFCTFNREIKDSFVDNHLLSHIQNIWMRTATSHLLRHCLLQLLVTLSNECEKAQTGMCSTIVASTISEEISLLQHVIKLLITLHNESSAVNGKFNPCLPLCFDILTNLSNTSQCRQVVIKSNLFNLFVSAHALTYSAKKLQRNNGRKLTNEWSKLSSVITFHSDAAKVIGKLTGCFEILLEMIKNGNTLKKERSLMTLRNLMFVPVYKQTISSDEVILQNVLDQLSNKSIRIKLLVVSFFWVVLYENQKAKIFLKKVNMGNQLQNVMDISTKDEKGGDTWYKNNMMKAAEKVQKLLTKMDF